MTPESFPQKKDQIVHDQDKAHEMAQVEDPYREMAAEFKKYMEAPDLYRTSEDERVKETKATGAFTSSDADMYMDCTRLVYVLKT